MTSSVVRALRLVSKTPADIIHLHDPELLPLGLLLRALGKSVVYDMHENFPEQIKTKYWVPKWLAVPAAAAVTLLERIAFNRMGVVMAEASYSEHYEWVRRRTVVQNFPVLDWTIQEAPKHQVPTAGYIGGVTVNRGALTVVRAIQKVRDSGLEMNFDCIGEVYASVSGDPAFRRAAGEGWISAPGRLPPRDGWPRIARCQVGVAVLKNIPNYVSSFPTKMFEYMAMGLPVVVSDFPLYKEVVESHGCGICVDPDDVDAIAGAFRNLIENPARAREMGENGRRAVRTRYNWDTELLKLSAFYQNEILT
jgi:glycosyltransferase involved in cell wall biosynthesis